MSEGCVDLTSDPELESTGVVRRKARHTGESVELYWLITIERFDNGVSDLRTRRGGVVALRFRRRCELSTKAGCRCFG